MEKIRNFLIMCSVLLAICSCGSGSDSEVDPSPPVPEEKLPIRISLSLNSITRATEQSFENGDKIGLFVTNYENGQKTKLKTIGNQVDNECLTFNGMEWKSAKPLYWKDQTTKSDFYCYYPYTSSLSDVDNYVFNLTRDQRTDANYLSNNFLWGKAENVSPTSDAVPLKVFHAFSKIRINFIPGDGYTDASLASAEKTIMIQNLKCSALINFNDWTITASGSSEIIYPKAEDGHFVAMVIPQQIDNKELISVTIDGYTYSLTQSMNIQSNKMYNCSLKINKTSEGINISISPWDEDNIDYGGTLN